MHCGHLECNPIPFKKYCNLVGHVPRTELDYIVMIPAVIDGATREIEPENMQALRPSPEISPSLAGSGAYLNGACRTFIATGNVFFDPL
jgi:hypothetical protein